MYLSLDILINVWGRGLISLFEKKEGIIYFFPIGFIASALCMFRIQNYYIAVLPLAIEGVIKWQFARQFDKEELSMTCD